MLNTTATVSDAEIVLLIDSAMDEISTVSFWPFLEKNATVTAVADQQTYATPSDFLHAVALVDDDNDNAVTPLAPSAFFAQYGNDTGNKSTLADFWTIWEDNIYLTPIPSTNDTNRWTLYYYRDITALANDAAIPEFHVSFHQGIVEFVKWKLWEREEFFDQADRSFARYLTYLARMKDFYITTIQRPPYIGGDGRRQRFGDPNIPILWRI